MPTATTLLCCNCAHIIHRPPARESQQQRQRPTLQADNAKRNYPSTLGTLFVQLKFYFFPRHQAWGSPSSDRKALALHGYLDNTGSFDLMGPALAKVPNSPCADSDMYCSALCACIAAVQPCASRQPPTALYFSVPPAPPPRLNLMDSAVHKEGIEFVAMDFPGHGRSDHMSQDSWYSILEYPEYVIEAAR